MGYGIEALEEEGKEYYYHKDERNSTTYLSNERREIENRYAYDGYGRSQRKDEGVENAIRYTGQRYEEELEGYCLGVREYREEYGRFLTEDAYEGDGTNLYAYCRNNPIKYYDPSGYSGETNQTEKGHTTPEGEEGETPSAGTEGRSGAGMPSTREELHQDLLDKGYRCNGTSAGGYVTYMHPDGRRVDIRPNGEVINTQKEWLPDHSRKITNRYFYDGTLVPNGGHNTGEFVDPIGDNTFLPPKPSN